MRRNKMSRWKKIAALLLSAAMAVPMAPGTAYGAEDPNSAVILEEAGMPEPQAQDSPEVFLQNETLPQNDALSPNENAPQNESHKHTWDYRSIVSGSASGTISCCSANQDETACILNVGLTLSGNGKLIVSANGEEKELPEDNDLGIQYRREYGKYVENEGTDEWNVETSRPIIPGDYKVRVYFGETTYYLETDHKVHDHSWEYVSENNIVRAVCQECTEEIMIALTVSENLEYKDDPEQDRGVSLSANDAGGGSITADGLKGSGISWNFVYYKDENGKPSDTALDHEPQDVGRYHVKVFFGEGDSAVLWGTFTIVEAEKDDENNKVEMKDYTYGDEGAQGPSLNSTVGIKDIKYYFYKNNEEEPFKEIQEGSNFDPKFLDAWEGYQVQAKYRRDDESDHRYVTEKTVFTVKKAKQPIKGIKVKKEYDLTSIIKFDPKLELESGKEISESASVNFYIKHKGKDIDWKNKKDNAKLSKDGSYVIYAEVAETTNYKGYTTPECKFTVYKDHKWKMPKTLPATEKEQKEKVGKCSCCGRSVTLPMKKVSVSMGESVRLAKDKGFTFTTKTEEGYFKLSKNGTMTTKKTPAYYSKMKKKITVAVKGYGERYTMNVELKIPEPDITYKVRKISGGYRFQFFYKVPGASRMEVWIDKEQKKKIDKGKQLDNYLNKYFKKQRPNWKPYINFSKETLKKLKYKPVKFNFIAYYGKNKSKMKTIEVVYPAKKSKR